MFRTGWVCLLAACVPLNASRRNLEQGMLAEDRGCLVQQPRTHSLARGGESFVESGGDTAGVSMGEDV